jgi:hypothetical protein
MYLHNRTPRYTYNWKVPYDRFFFEFMSLETNEIVCTNRKQQLDYLKVYGCKTYALTTEYLKKTQRKKLRLHPKAWIGYLNLVIFNEDEWKSWSLKSNILDTIPESQPTDTENEKSFIKGFIWFKISPSLAESFHKWSYYDWDLRKWHRPCTQRDRTLPCNGTTFSAKEEFQYIRRRRSTVVS